MQQLLANSRSGRRFNLILLTDCVGRARAGDGWYYGVMSYTVAQRTHEIGIRVAVGAQIARCISNGHRSGNDLAMIGVAFGLAGAFALTRLMTSISSAWSQPIRQRSLVSRCCSRCALVACYIPSRKSNEGDRWWR